MEAIVHYLYVTFAIIAGLVVLSSLRNLIRYGPIAYIRSAFDMDAETWRFIEVLALPGIFALMAGNSF